MIIIYIITIYGTTVVTNNIFNLKQIKIMAEVVNKTTNFNFVFIKHMK